ncbi:hypothetical protein L1887_49833 [Cichorium endivia]|nr:hypothetical protein L1887_49833 [Cichorium endivia]
MAKSTPLDRHQFGRGNAVIGNTSAAVSSEGIGGYGYHAERGGMSPFGGDFARSYSSPLPIVLGTDLEYSGSVQAIIGISTTQAERDPHFGPHVREFSEPWRVLQICSLACRHLANRTD